MGMIIRQGFSFKLKPDGAQERKMSRFAGCTRWVYNQGLAWNEERRSADPTFRLSYAKLCSELLVWKERDCHEFCVHGIIGARHTGTPHEHDYQETNLS